jgi:hypothetical protein
MMMACDYLSRKSRRNGLGFMMTITLDGLLDLLIRMSQMVSNALEDLRRLPI